MLAAFGILPLVDALVAFAAFPAVWWLSDQGGFQLADPIEAARAFGILSGVLGLLVTLCGAVPVVFWLMRRGPLSAGQLAIAGLALGNVPFAVYLLALVPFAIGHLAAGTMSQHLIPVSELLAGTLRAVAIGSTLGVTSAIVFWFIGIREGKAG